MGKKLWASLILFFLFLFAIAIFGSYNNNVQQANGITLTNQQLAQAHLTLGLQSTPNITIQTTAPQSPYTSATIDT
jgi:hypothetical protein